MTNFVSLKNSLLVAMPSLIEPTFKQAVVLLFEHSEQGAAGLIINKPTKLQFNEVFDTDKNLSLAPVIFNGGPVELSRGFIIHADATKWDKTLQISNTLSITISTDILASLAPDSPNDHLQVFLGYSGWGPNQLEQELANNIWLNVPLDEKIIFTTPIESRWQEAADILGIQIGLISPEIGHG